MPNMLTCGYCGESITLNRSGAWVDDDGRADCGPADTRHVPQTAVDLDRAAHDHLRALTNAAPPADPGDLPPSRVITTDDAEARVCPALGEYVRVEFGQRHVNTTNPDQDLSPLVINGKQYGLPSSALVEFDSHNVTEFQVIAADNLWQKFTDAAERKMREDIVPGVIRKWIDDYPTDLAQWWTVAQRAHYHGHVARELRAVSDLVKHLGA